MRAELELKIAKQFRRRARAARRRPAWMPALLAALCIGVGAHSVRAAGASKEYAVKAAFLVKFAHYVHWPAASFPAADTPISIGVLGEDPFGDLLDQLVQGDAVGTDKRKIMVKRSKKLDDLKSCQVLFIGKTEAAQIAQVLAGLGQAGILTVGETEGFAHRGGIINFYLAGENGDKVRFEINNDAAESRGLKIDPGLLRLATVVHK